MTQGSRRALLLPIPALTHTPQEAPLLPTERRHPFTADFVEQLVDARRCLDAALPEADLATLETVAASEAIKSGRAAHVLVLELQLLDMLSIRVTGWGDMENL